MSEISTADDGHAKAVPIHLLIDTDPGIDDAVALALAARLERLRVVAITAVHGNADVAHATRNAREIARRAGLRAPVVAGAARPLQRESAPARETHGPEGLGYFTPAAPAAPEPDGAAERIASAAHEHPGLTLCCLGPLTNLAHALARDPALPSRLGPVFAMGGALGVRGTQTRWSEFNWWADPEAADAVLRAGLDLRLVPLDVTRRIAIPGEAIGALAAAAEHDEGARFWADALRFYADFHRSWERFDGCVVNDALAVTLVADPALATWRDERLAVSRSDDDRRGAVSRDPGGAPARVAFDVRAREVVELVGRLVFARWVKPETFAAGAEAAERWLAEHPLHEEGRAR
ncbi:MAG TPA: nucleoside hydrolase [Gemmatimonadaceae bacterium]|nr:nucleoside hydrolase [Gemmatimonadaceae bacterium]